jgi:hypothetical protein
MTSQEFIPNPDADEINRKEIINISYVDTDLTSSNYDYTTLVQKNYSETEVVIYNNSGSINQPGYVYYTPLYTEKISYNQWKKTINKSFKELGNV